MTLKNPLSKPNPYYVPDTYFRSIQNYICSFNDNKKWKDCQHCSKLKEANHLHTSIIQHVTNPYKTGINSSSLNKQIKKQSISKLKEFRENPFLRTQLLRSSNDKLKYTFGFTRKDQDNLKKLKQENPFRSLSSDKNQIQYYSNSMFPSFAGYLCHKNIDQKQKVSNLGSMKILEPKTISLKKIGLKHKNQKEQFQNYNSKMLDDDTKKNNLQIKDIQRRLNSQKQINLQGYGQEQDAFQITFKGKQFYLNKVSKFI